MINNNNGSFSLNTTDLPDDFWNEYRFVYMTQEGQKESEWYQKTTNSSDEEPIVNENQGATAELSYSIDNSKITVNSTAVTGYIIIHLAKDNNIIGGYYMNSTGNGNFSLDYPIPKSEWNKLRFIYMAKDGQKESEWVTIN